MACKYCNDKDESKLVMRSRVVNGKVETVNICTSCLWEQLLNDHSEDGTLLSNKDSHARRIPQDPTSTDSRVSERII
jgi:hypothetical protein